MARKRAEDRRQELLEAAQEVIRRDGFANLTLREVASEVGVAHSLVRHYFGSRDQLLSEAFDVAARDDAPGPEPEHGTHLERLVERTEPLDRDHYLMWIDAWSEAPRSPELKATLCRFEDRCQQRLAGVLADGAAAGEWEVDDPLRSARRINAGTDGMAIQHYTLGRMSRAELDEEIRLLLERELHLRAGALADVGAPADG